MQIPPAQPVACPPRKARTSRPQIGSSKILPIQHPWGPLMPSPLRRDSPWLFSSSSMFTSDRSVAALPNCLHNPLLCALAFTGHFCKWTHPPGSRPRFEATSPALYFSTLHVGHKPRGLECEPPEIPMMTSVAYLPLSAAFHLRALSKIETRILRPLLNLPASSLRSKRPSAQSLNYVERRIRVVVSPTPYLRHDRWLWIPRSSFSVYGLAFSR